MQPYVLVLYYSKYGSTKEMAHLIANGIEATGIAVKIRTVPELSTVVEMAAPSIPAEGIFIVVWMIWKIVQVWL